MGSILGSPYFKNLPFSNQPAASTTQNGLGRIGLSHSWDSCCMVACPRSHIAEAMGGGPGSFFALAVCCLLVLRSARRWLPAELRHFTMCSIQNLKDVNCRIWLRVQSSRGNYLRTLCGMSLVTRFLLGIACRCMHLLFQNKSGVCSWASDVLMLLPLQWQRPSINHYFGPWLSVTV